jgi:hypothetical protein
MSILQGRMIKTDGTYHSYGSKESKKAQVKDDGVLTIYVYRRIEDGMSVRTYITSVSLRYIYRS